MSPDQIEALRRGAEAPETASLDQLDGLADDLSASFAEDPQFDWFMRADARRAAARLAFFRMILKEIAFKDGEVTRPQAGGAAAIWIPSQNLGPNPLVTELLALPAILAATGLARLPRMLAMRKAMDEHHPMDRPHAYLWFLGVRPQAQGLGIGSRMLAAGLAKVDAQGLPAFLESSNVANVPLYRRFGFEVVEEYRVAPDAPPIFAMWRDPRPGA